MSFQFACRQEQVCGLCGSIEAEKKVEMAAIPVNMPDTLAI